MENNFSILRTDSYNQDFIALIKMLDTLLQEVDGEDHNFYAQYNTLNTIKNVIVLHDDDVPIACGAFKKFDEYTIEIKRMFTHPAHRGKLAATRVLAELENWAIALNYTNAVLETGINLTNAIKLYTQNGYTKRVNYGQYIGIENSICFEKKFSLLNVSPRKKEIIS